MFESNYNILCEMLIDLKRELFEINTQIQRNLLYIREEEVCMQSIESSDSEDLKIFFPRILSSLQKEEIEKANLRKIDFEKQNIKLNKDKALLEERIKIFENVLKQENHQITELHIQNLSYLVHQIELCSLYIDLDPEKAKYELSIISKNLKEIVNKIQNAIRINKE